MKKTEKFNIGGFAFHVEQDAAEALGAYIDSIRKKYEGDGSSDEICSDIEERIGELLLERSGEQRVVSLVTVEYAKSIMGDFSSEDDAGNREKQVPHRLYRDVRSRLLGGVFSGLAAYTNKDVALFRIIYLLLWIPAFFIDDDFGGSVIVVLMLAYFIAWICIPAARTVEQICSLESKPVTLDSFAGAGRQAHDRKSSEMPRTAARVLMVFIGVLLLITGTGLLVGCSVFDKIPGIICVDDAALNGLVETIFSGKLLIALTASFLFSAIWAIYVGVILIFDLKAPAWRPGLILLILAFVAFLLFMIFTARTAVGLSLFVGDFV